MHTISLYKVVDTVYKKYPQQESNLLSLILNKMNNIKPLATRRGDDLKAVFISCSSNVIVSTEIKSDLSSLYNGRYEISKYFIALPFCSLFSLCPFKNLFLEFGVAFLFSLFIKHNTMKTDIHIYINNNSYPSNV